MESPIIFEEYNILVSAELLNFLQWLSTQEQDTLKHFIKKAFYDTDNYTSPLAPTPNPEELKEHITQFFATLDALILEVKQEESLQQALNNLLVPAINHVDVTQCSAETIAKSIEKMASSSELITSPEAKEVFCRALLRNWTPQSDKQTVN